MSAHTPGPWKAHKNTTTHSICDNSGTVICKVDTAYSLVSGKTERMRANARLIAAAPMLLDALESVVRQIEPILEKQRFGYVGAIQSARAAIAAAKGEA